MVRIHQIRLPLTHNREAVECAIRKKIGLKSHEKFGWNISRESLDLRKTNEPKVVYSIDISIAKEELLKKRLGNDAEILPLDNKDDAMPIVASIKKRLTKPPVIIGFGPAGMFAAEYLSRLGYCPVIIERGSRVEKRIQEIERFWEAGILNPESNVQFGEGGAGTFSDGKLTSRSKDPRGQKVLDIFAELGAPDEIRYRQKPHIGTDLLRTVVVEMRRKIESQGGHFHFDLKLESFDYDNQGQYTLYLSDGTTLVTELLILAIGHSARDTFEMLCHKSLMIMPKPFAVGVRIEHLQSQIDDLQYGPHLSELRARYGAAEYQLTAKTSVGKGVYTFCMCPGGEVVAAASEAGGVVTNGMSFHARNNANSNSALLVSVTPEDFAEEEDGPLGILAGVEFQRALERAAFHLGGETYAAPYMTAGEFLGHVPFSADISKGDLKPTYRPKAVKADFRTALPPVLLKALQEGLTAMGEKMKGFADADVIITAFETRSSSPIRINRHEISLESISHPGLFPCGEGAGYAGGITSSAIDGIRVAEIISEKWLPAEET